MLPKSERVKSYGNPLMNLTLGSLIESIEVSNIRKWRFFNDSPMYSNYKGSNLVAQENRLKGKLMAKKNPACIYSYKEAAHELKRDEKEVEEAIDSLELILPFSRRNLKKVEEHIASFHAQKINQSAQEREREKKEEEEKEKQQILENSRLDQERKMKSVLSDCLHLTAVQELQKDAEAIESQNQEDEDTPDFD